MPGTVTVFYPIKLAYITGKPNVFIKQYIRYIVSLYYIHPHIYIPKSETYRRGRGMQGIVKGLVNGVVGN